MPKGWITGQVPWVRNELEPSRKNKTQCPFCGEKSAILSFGDLDLDTGRVELYCDSQSCEARQFIVLALKDGERASLRADVWALYEIDEDPAFKDKKSFLLSERMDSTDSGEDVLARRLGVDAQPNAYRDDD